MENMSRLTLALILFLILFVIIFISDYIIIRRSYQSKSKKKKKQEIMELDYLIKKFNLKKDNLPIKRVLLCIALINAFIMALVMVVILVLKAHIILKLLLGFVLLMALIYAIYELYGRYLERNYKNGN